HALCKTKAFSGIAGKDGTRVMKSISIAFAGLFVAVSVHAKEPPPKEALAGIDSVIEQALKTFRVPGVAVAVVVGDEVTLSKGYGLRDVENNLPMTPETQLPIASATKQFTVAALGTLVRQGRLDWDKPVREYLPDFRLHNEYATSHATPRDLVTHRIGLPRHDWIWYGTNLTREQIYHRLPHFGFSRDLRVRFQYNNLMYMTAGYLGGTIAKSSWEELVKNALFTPLGMKRSNFAVAAMHLDSNHSLAYELNTKREVVKIEHTELDAGGPAGAINSSVDEMARYAGMMLAGGVWEGKRVLLETDVQGMMQPQVPIGKDLFGDVFGFLSYGMGLFVQTYRGTEIAHHGGNINGSSTLLVLVPAKRIGVVVLANRSATRLRDALPFEIIDRLLGLPSAGLLARHQELEEKGFAGEDAAKSAGITDRKPNTAPAHPLAEYAAEYEHPGYGPVKVGLEQNRLTLSYNKFTAPLDHWHYEVFQSPADRQNPLELTRVQFHSDMSGEVTGLAIPLEPNVEPIVFQRQPPAEMRDRKFLEAFAGEYDSGGVPVTISLREDNVLQYIVLGNVRELLPVRGAYFRFKDSQGWQSSSYAIRPVNLTAWPSTDPAPKT
ncbi:MAG: serine hydrolase, partial [Verrucomicrobiota bacterium]|nr:serine hydrolase [Verrucomicrobiota bacterium]